MNRLLITALLACLPNVSLAQEDLRLMGDLGTIIGSAEPCGYSLNDDTVSAFISERVPASDLGFADTLRTNIGYKRQLAADMSGLERRVFCEATKRSAESLGFLMPE